MLRNLEVAPNRSLLCFGILDTPQVGLTLPSVRPSSFFQEILTSTKKTWEEKHPLKINGWNLKIIHLKKEFLIFQPSIFRGYVRHKVPGPSLDHLTCKCSRCFESKISTYPTYETNRPVAPEKMSGSNKSSTTFTKI